MLKTKTAAVIAAAAMVSSLIPITANAAYAIPSARGLAEITDFGVDNVIAMYEVENGSVSYYSKTDENKEAFEAEAAKLFDKEINTNVMINVSKDEMPKIGGFVLDAGEGNTFADVAELGISCVGQSDGSGNGAHLYIYGSDKNIAEAIEAKKDTDLLGTNFSSFTKENLDIDIAHLTDTEEGYYQLPGNYEQSGLANSFWSVYELKNVNTDYRYLFVGTPELNTKWRTDELKLFKIDTSPRSLTAEIKTGEETGSVKFTNSDGGEITEAAPGSSVKIEIEMKDGYEFGKLNVNGVTTMPELSDNRTKATYTIDSLMYDTTIEVWADPVGRLTMNEMTADEFREIAPDITKFMNMPDGFSDYNVAESKDYAGYGTFTVYDAGEGNKYKLSEVITYARPNMPARAHIKIFGADDLSADDFDNTNGANTGKLTTITHKGEGSDPNFFGTGDYTTNKDTGGTDSVRGDYKVTENDGYRYIIIHSDHKVMLSLTELKIYGTLIEGEKTHDSDYFGFEASEEELKGYNSIAIKLDDEDTYTSGWTAPTSFNGEATVKYAVKITDLPADKTVTDMRLYKADTVSAE